jgi:cytochrome o ubiquinol oxidase operon protein cyoD
MSATHHEPAPILAQEGPGHWLIYTTGLALALILTATSFWVANTSLLWSPGIPLGLAVLAIAQMGVHLVFFLHMTSGRDNLNHALALAFGVLFVFMVVAGSLWIMADLNSSMAMPGMTGGEMPLAR